jgi:hypothetical protein
MIDTVIARRGVAGGEGFERVVDWRIIEPHSEIGADSKYIVPSFTPAELSNIVLTIH